MTAILFAVIAPVPLPVAALLVVGLVLLVSGIAIMRGSRRG